MTSLASYKKLHGSLNVGGWLSGELQGKKSTRIAKRYRLIFTPDEMQKVVYLNWIDHREHVY
jgi:mRNA-degrading endonuclease RelE of RelBE toxin-antitoxin system